MLNRVKSCRKSHNAEKKLEEWTLWDFSTFLSQNIKKTEGGLFGEKKSDKKSQNAEKMEGWTLWNFLNIHSIAKHPKNLRGPFEVT